MGSFYRNDPHDVVRVEQATLQAANHHWNHTAKASVSLQCGLMTSSSVAEMSKVLLFTV